MLPLVLASSSPYRYQLLERLGLPFAAFAPSVDESPRKNETAEQLVARLAETKARVGADRYPAHLLIGSDQVAELDGQILTKPGSHQDATRQLRACNGKVVRFHTGLCLFNSASQHYQLDVVPFDVTFRNLSDDTIERYLRAEQPYNCAGSFKMEGLGIALFEKLSGDDPNTLIGLPLIRLVTFLQKEGICIP